MNFLVFSTFLEKLDTTSSRLEITQILSELLTALEADEIKAATYLLNGSIGPSYEQHLFNVAEKMLLRAISEAYEKPLDEIQKEYKRVGDVGEVVYSLATEHSKRNAKSILEITADLKLLTEESGDGSQEKRVTLIAQNLKEMPAVCAKYFVRIITGSMRLGFSERTIIDALSWMETGGKTKSTPILRSFEVVPDIGTLAERIKKMGIEKATHQLLPIVGIPVQPMLCQRLKSPADMVKKMGKVSVEPKFDGLRVLIHYSKKHGVLKAFTRNLKDISAMFPELSHIADHIHADEIILDSEAVGMDHELMKILDFQTTMQRRRKHEVVEMQNKIPVTFQVFDILYKDGESLMETPYLDRRNILSKTVKNGTLLKVDANEVTDDPERITELHEQYRGAGLEGIIVKKIDSIYVPGRLGWRWVKMKEAEASTGKLSDTIDAVVMGYSQGQGKRAGFGIGQFLIGILDHGTLKTISKVGTGLTDEQFKELYSILSALVVSEKPKEYEVHKNLEPDYWVKPEIVVEVAADDITVSPNHTAGYALRFPRLVKIRGDKSVKQSTSLKEFVEMFHLQKK